jgi:hypothetical protein
MWQPNRSQWWIIWGVYFAALLVSVDWTTTRYETRALTLDETIAAAREKLALHTELARVRDSLKKIGESQPYTLAQARQRLDLERKEADLEREISIPLPEHRVSIEELDPSLPLSGILTFLVIGGGLAVWRAQGNRAAS